MKYKVFGILLIVVVSLFLSVGATYIVYLNQGKIGITGLVTETDDDNEEDESGVKRVTREDAEEAIEEINNILEEIDEKGLKTRFFEDKLFEAEKALERVDNVFIVRDDSLSYLEKREARNALRLVEGWEKIEDYSEVLRYLEDSENAREKAVFARDLFSHTKEILEREKRENAGNPDVQLAPAENLFVEAEEAFEDERYVEAEQLLLSARDEIEAQRDEVARLRVLRRGILNFFQRNWKILSILFIIFGVIGYFAYGRISREMLAKKIQKMSSEKQAIEELMKRAQVERYKENSISGMVYNIRMKKYQEKLSTIKEELPVLEGKLVNKLKAR